MFLRYLQNSSFKWCLEGCTSPSDYSYSDCTLDEKTFLAHGKIRFPGSKKYVRFRVGQFLDAFCLLFYFLAEHNWQKSLFLNLFNLQLAVWRLTFSIAA